MSEPVIKTLPTWWVTFLNKEGKWDCQDVKALNTVDALKEFKEVWDGEYQQTGMITRTKPL